VKSICRPHRVFDVSQVPLAIVEIPDGVEPRLVQLGHDLTIEIEIDLAVVLEDEDVLRLLVDINGITRDIRALEIIIVIAVGKLPTPGAGVEPLIQEVVTHQVTAVVHLCGHIGLIDLISPSAQEEAQDGLYTGGILVDVGQTGGPAHTHLVLAFKGIPGDDVVADVLVVVHVEGPRARQGPGPAEGKVHPRSAWEGHIGEAQGDLSGLGVHFPGFLVEGEVFVRVVAVVPGLTKGQGGDY
jgi:hypothetical protein